MTPPCFLYSGTGLMMTRLCLLSPWAPRTIVRTNVTIHDPSLPPVTKSWSLDLYLQDTSIILSRSTELAGGGPSLVFNGIATWCALLAIVDGGQAIFWAAGVGCSSHA